MHPLRKLDRAQNTRIKSTRITYIDLIKGVFDCNLELFQSNVDSCFLPAEKDAFVRICTRVRGLYTRLQIKLSACSVPFFLARIRQRADSDGSWRYRSVDLPENLQKVGLGSRNQPQSWPESSQRAYLDYAPKGMFSCNSRINLEAPESI